MMKLNFRSLFVFFLLTGMFVSQVLPLDSSFGLFEREEVRERTMSESKADKTDGAPLQLTYAIAPYAWSIIQVQSYKYTLNAYLVSIYMTCLIGHAQRGPPVVA